MKIFIVAMNDGEFAHVAHLCEITSESKSVAKDSRAFFKLESAKRYAQEWSAKDGIGISKRCGSGGITIFEIEIEENNE
jgi:hypothetical protein